ncbi:helix-turn-helix transcriptional regulator, partial [Anaerorhabdus sp.]|uniref:helix-turn-helix transcriptional regulator n=1 Tax=Anaerorhabdus sp. TaxID=1872524 RepID=UPI002FC585B2
MKFNEKLLQLRKEKGYSQEELAQKLGVSRQAISKWEVSDSYPEMENILEICKLFDVSMDYMLKEGVMRDKNDDVSNQSKKYGFMLGTIICIIGLLFSAVGWYETQTMSAVGMGVIIQFGGFVVYQLLKGSTKDDFKFYSFFSLLILPYF